MLLSMKRTNTPIQSFLGAILHSLPVQLFFHNLKKNLFLLFVWSLVVAAFSGALGKVYGIHYLFLTPEYLGRVSFWSFFLVGLAFGTLLAAWNITTYILDSHRFRFLGALERPFSKFSLNNGIIPLLVLIAYLLKIIDFQLGNTLTNGWGIIQYVGGFLLGLGVLQLLLTLYFKATNKNIFKYVTLSLDKRLRKTKVSRDRMMNKFRENKADKYPVSSYLDLRLRVKPTAPIKEGVDKEAILKVFDQNHFNSVAIELVIIGLILLMSFFMENPYAQIPAAASALLILAILVMLAGAISYWFKAWGVAFALGLFILVNAGVKLGMSKGVNHAVGLNYDTLLTEYTIPQLEKIHSKAQYEHDHMHMEEILESWKAKLGADEKQKMIILCVSGGGQRAALWTTTALLKLDQALNGRLMDQTFLMTGASGGLIGAAYYREAWYRSPKIAMTPRREDLLTNISKDNLNPVIFSLLVHDLFLKVRKHEYHGRKYPIDRGFIFEENLNRNLGGLLDKTIADYHTLERAAEVPVLLMSPTIANDGRKLYISAQPLSFMCTSAEILDKPDQKMRGVDFQSFFAANSPGNLRFLSALRMSASFPYITPNISLPASPRVEIMDAGISDNYGLADALKFINVFKNWISNHTDGVVLVVIRDNEPNAPIALMPAPSVIDRLTYPISSVYNNLTKMQDINNDLNLELIKERLAVDLDLIEISYDAFEEEGTPEGEERASLSWHLTTEEKNHVIHHIDKPENQAKIQALKELIKP